MRFMKVLHLTTGVSTQSAVYRLHKALLNEGIESYIYAGIKSLDEKEILYNRNDLRLKILARIERQLLNLYPRREPKPWNIGFFDNTINKTIKEINPDIIHLHWINQFVSIKQIAKFNKPIVWTLHDSWPFTGGCHIPYPCEKFKIRCEQCPQLNSKKAYDLSRVIFDLKKKSWEGTNLNIIGPSKWMAQCAQESNLLSRHRILNIPNCIDTEYYNPKDKVLSRLKFNLPVDKKLILFGANNAKNDKNKGYDLLLEAFKILRKKKSDVELVVFGSKEIKYNKESGIHEIGYINNPKIFPYLYSSADVVVNASISENFSNVILESLACGTPVAAFNIGGNSDFQLIEQDMVTLAPAFSMQVLANNIHSQLVQSTNPNHISKLIENNFGLLKIANTHHQLYLSL